MGHKHLLDVLVYCWTILVALPPTAEAGRIVRTSNDDEEPRMSDGYNRFGPLQDDDTEDNEHEDLGDTGVPRHEQEPRPMSLKHFMKFVTSLIRSIDLDSLYLSFALLYCYTTVVIAIVVAFEMLQSD